MYKYDIHIHTAETSRCGHLKAAEIVNAYKKLGYAGICITDHLHDFYFDIMEWHDDWQKCIDRFMYGYKLAKEAGDAAGLDVIFGAEIRFTENDNDFLLFGIDEDWLRSRPFVCHVTHREFFHKYGDSVLILQAHPYRDKFPVLSDCIHGLEVANCNPRQKNRNELAVELALSHPELIRVCASDTHQWGDEGQAGIILPNPVKDSYEMKAAIEKRSFSLWCPVWEEVIRPCAGKV
ncbi:MAG: PHP domain-containing protein [Peptococcaceae bacterium]|nr:PHP domain-containing protein [Peptococcaceae bacterium]